MIIDISTTSSCNYGCKYCSEGLCSEEDAKARYPNSLSKLNVDSLKIFINNVRADRPNEEITIGFWGGEPMLNWKFCKTILHEFKDDPHVVFLFYTNGFFIDKYLEDLKEILNVVGYDRLRMQVSYDGKAINDQMRVTKKGEPTSDTCLYAYNLLKDNGIQVKFKSTLPIQCTDKLFECFKEFVDIGEAYFPTPDVASWYDVDNIDTNIYNLQHNLMQIAQYIVQHDLDPEMFHWFSYSKAKCAAGVDYIALDVDGAVVPCHSAMFSGDDHKWGNIADLDIWNKIKAKFKEYKKLQDNIGTGPECSKCDALYCMTCPACTYDLLQGSYDERWSGRNPNMCLVFKCSDLVHKALRAAIAKKRKTNEQQ